MGFSLHYFVNIYLIITQRKILLIVFFLIQTNTPQLVYQRAPNALQHMKDSSLLMEIIFFLAFSDHKNQIYKLINNNSICSNDIKNIFKLILLQARYENRPNQEHWSYIQN